MRRLALIACVLSFAVLAPQAQSRPLIPPTVFKAVRTYWPTRPERIEAFNVSWCESRFSPFARNGQYLGLFQMGSYERARYGHGWDAFSQAHAAYRSYVDSGRDWSPWSCRP